MAEKRKTQKEVILEHLRKYGSITSMEAIEKYHITRLAAVIFGKWISILNRRRLRTRLRIIQEAQSR